MGASTIHCTLSSEARAAVCQAIGILEQQLGALLGLSRNEKNALSEPVDHKLGFAEQASEVAQNHQPVLPPGFDAEEFAQDLDLYHQLRMYQRRLTPLLARLDDTTAAAGTHALRDALAVYGCAKVSGAGRILEQLVSQMEMNFSRFEKQKSQ